MQSLNRKILNGKSSCVSTVTQFSLDDLVDDRFKEAKLEIGFVEGSQEDINADSETIPDDNDIETNEKAEEAEKGVQGNVHIEQESNVQLLSVIRKRRILYCCAAGCVVLILLVIAIVLATVIF